MFLDKAICKAKLNDVQDTVMAYLYERKDGATYGCVVAHLEDILITAMGCKPKDGEAGGITSFAVRELWIRDDIQELIKPDRLEWWGLTVNGWLKMTRQRQLEEAAT